MNIIKFLILDGCFCFFGVIANLLSNSLNFEGRNFKTIKVLWVLIFYVLFLVYLLFTPTDTMWKSIL